MTAPNRTTDAQPSDGNRDYVTSAATTSPHTAAGAAALGVEVWGSTEAPNATVRMLNLADHFPYTVATDLALAGYDVLGYAPIPAWLVTE